MKINYGLFSLDINIEKENVSFEGYQTDWYGEKKEDVFISYKLGSTVFYKKYATKYKAKLIKINQKSVILENNGELIKKDLKHFVINNLYPNFFYRIENKDSGLGPFQHKLKSELLNKKILARVQYLKESNNYTEYPTPQIDKTISKVWNQFDSSFRKENTKFACIVESHLYHWFGSDLVKDLLENNFIIKKYQQGQEFSNVVYGQNQVLLLKTVPKFLEEKEVVE